MKIGITGSRHGMTHEQRERVFKMLKDNYDKGNELHHGDCLGVDVEVATYAKSLGFRVICHPPSKDFMRAYHDSHEFRDKHGYIQRDKNIVDETEVLIAVPNSLTPKKHSGTWFTYNYALSQNKLTFLVLPEGGSTID